MAGLAINGYGNEYDVTLKLGDEAITTTAQYRCVCADPTSTTGDITANFPVTTGALNNFVGIIQNYITSSSDAATVRLIGVSKAFAYDSIAAFDPIRMALKTAGAAETGYVNVLTPKTDFTTAAVLHRAVGIALQSAQKTGAALGVLIAPSYIYV